MKLPKDDFTSFKFSFRNGDVFANQYILKAYFDTTEPELKCKIEIPVISLKKNEFSKTLDIERANEDISFIDPLAGDLSLIYPNERGPHNEQDNPVTLTSFSKEISSAKTNNPNHVPSSSADQDIHRKKTGLKLDPSANMFSPRDAFNTSGLSINDVKTPNAPS